MPLLWQCGLNEAFTVGFTSHVVVILTFFLFFGTCLFSGLVEVGLVEVQLAHLVRFPGRFSWLYIFLAH
jgi:hypothetical protein